MPSTSTTIISKCTIFPHQKSAIDKTFKLSISDLPMLSCHHIQKGVLLTAPPYSFEELLVFLKDSLSVALSHFPTLARRFITDSDGYVHILCNGAGVDFIHANAEHLAINTIHYSCSNTDVPNCFKEFFAYDKTISYSGHNIPPVAVQIAELAGGVFNGCAVNHAVTDGTSFWHFFNTFAEICRGAKNICKSPDFSRDTVFNSDAVLKVPAGGPKVTFADDEPLHERVFHFSREAIQSLKNRANATIASNDFLDSTEFIGKQANDSWKIVTN